MGIAQLVTRGYGTFGDVNSVTVRGYTSGEFDEGVQVVHGGGSSRRRKKKETEEYVKRMRALYLANQAAKREILKEDIPQTAKIQKINKLPEITDPYQYRMLPDWSAPSENEPFVLAGDIKPSDIAVDADVRAGDDHEIELLILLEVL